ncbi:MAG TPA: hypothetical protein VK445_00765 [Dissulfurispiraceae bacterium]|nr:hypothetical protein [Dissulfurispiraceae bacterium]
MNNPEVAARQVETLFLNELLKVMFEKTSFGKGKTVSALMPVITGHIADSLVERGIGISEFILKNQSMHASSRSGSGTSDTTETSIKPLRRGGGIQSRAGAQKISQGDGTSISLSI